MTFSEEDPSWNSAAYKQPVANQNAVPVNHVTSPVNHDVIKLGRDVTDKSDVSNVMDEKTLTSLIELLKQLNKDT